MYLYQWWRFFPGREHMISPPWSSVKYLFADFFIQVIKAHRVRTVKRAWPQSSKSKMNPGFSVASKVGLAATKILQLKDNRVSRTAAFL